MPQHDIVVTFRNGQYIYTDNQTGVVGPTHHVKNNDAIRWKSTDDDLTITYHGPGPAVTLMAPKDTFTNPITLHGNRHQGYKYDACIRGHSPDDPTIIFDDGMQDRSAPEASALANLAEAAFTRLLNDLRAVNEPGDSAKRRAPLFFPQGINLVSVQIAVTPLSVTLKVAGPGATGLEVKEE